MVTEKTMEKRLLVLNEERKKREFFVVKPTMGTNPPKKTSIDRLNGWMSMLKKVHLDSQLQDSSVEGNAVEGSNTVVLRFKNGLKIADKGQSVSFSACEDKEKSDVNKESAMTIIRCGANHLCRRGWDLGVDFESVRYGSAQMVLTFETAHKDAHRKLNEERVACLRHKPLQM